MRLEECKIYTIPMPASIQMKEEESSVVLEINGTKFEVKDTANATRLEYEIFHNEAKIQVSYEDPYDHKRGEKIFNLSYEKGPNYILLERVN